jgi:hypothetical protein
MFHSVSVILLLLADDYFHISLASVCKGKTVLTDVIVLSTPEKEQVVTTY